MTSPSSEGRYTKIGAIAGVIGVVVAVIAVIASQAGGSAPGGERTAGSLGTPAPTVVTATPLAVLSGSSILVPVPQSSLPERDGRPLSTYIEDLEVTPDSDPYDNRDIAQVNGQSYQHSQAAQFCFGANQRKWTYVLGRKYDSFQGVLGLSDNSTSEATIRFEIAADGQTVFSEDLRVGQSAPLDLPVGNILRIELITTLLTREGGCGAATGEWANIHAVG